MKKSLAIALLAFGAACFAQQDDKKDQKKQDPKPPEIEATIVALKGVVDVKRPDDTDWVEAKKDMKLKKGSEICTSVGAVATLLFTGNIRVDIKPLTQAKVDVLAKTGNKVEAGVKLKFGTVDVDVQKGDLRADMKVATPNSTTSVSGSNGTITAWASGDAQDISMRAFSGEWTQTLNATDTTSTYTNGEYTNDAGQLSGTMNFDMAMYNYTDYGASTGAGGPATTTIGTGAYQSGFLQPYQYGSTAYNPGAGAFILPASLPLPPPPPPKP